MPEHLDVVADFVEPCSHCGAACCGTILVWYSDGGRRVAFAVDRHGLAQPIETLISAATERGEYETLPSFAREWNESRGWAAFESDGASVDADDLLRTVDALEARPRADDARVAAMLAGLRSFLARAAGAGVELWAAQA